MAMVSTDLHILSKANGNTLVLSSGLNDISAYKTFLDNSWRIEFNSLTREHIVTLEESASVCGGFFDERYNEFVLPNKETAIEFLYELYNVSLKEKAAREKQSE